MAVYTTIDDPEAHFQTVIYTGNGSANHAITLPGDTDMQPDFVWIKNRDATDSHCLFDAVRGATKLLTTDVGNVVGAQETTDADTLDSFTSDGFQVDADDKVNTNTEKYVSWNWKAGTTSGIVTTGADITPSAYSFNQTAGISIIKYTGNSTTDQQIAHGLGAVPHFIICKVVDADNPQNWDTYHHSNTSAPETDYLSFNLPGGTTDAVARWQDTAPTSVLFTVGDAGAVNQTGDDIMAYCFTSIQGYSKFGGYGPGNATADGPFIYTGFKPAYLLIKIISGASIWVIQDNKRPGYNLTNLYSAGNTTAVEPSNLGVDLLSNGFKIRDSDSEVNHSGGTYIYAAFAEAPFVNSEGVPCNAR